MKLGTVVLCIVLAVLAGTMAGAEGNQNPPVPTMEGQVTAISATQITIKTEHQGQQAFNIGSQTMVSPHVQIVPGMQVKIVYGVGATGQKIARTITIVPQQTQTPPQPKLADVAGQVTQVSSTSISVQTEHRGVMTFAINADTVVRYRDNNVGLSEVKVGAPVGIVFTPSENGPLVAKRIIIRVTK